MASFEVARAGAILAVSDFERSLAFYRDTLGLEVEALYDEPPYATLVSVGARLSLAEQGHPAEDRPGVTMTAPDDASRANVVIVLEVEDAWAVYREFVPFCRTFASRGSRAGVKSASEEATPFDA